jgi:next-to-BRCA1 protein 1
VSPLPSDKLDTEGEAPVPHSFTARQSKISLFKSSACTLTEESDFFGDLANASHNVDLAFRPKEHAPQCSWVVFCNNCNQPMDDEHFHCSICDHGDYDLCPSCVDSGIHCPGAGHWMVKRFVKNGVVVNSTTERVGPKSKPEVEQTMEQNMPGAFTKPAFVEDEPTRTCNCCVKGKPPLPIVIQYRVLTCVVMSEKEFVTCTACDDYDLCMECHIGNKHGHHPGHAFKAATSDIALPALADFLCNAGRNVRHSAVCDGCEKFIYGVRHKCLNCPDWDFCSECVKNAKYIHPRHRFVPIYEPLAEPVPCAIRHYGIYCDGPLCKEKENPSYIEGTRYKCAVCHDLDFCANCEATPSNRHNRTHPLIKFKTPVRSVSVTTMSEDKNGLPVTTLGDLPVRKSTATETIPVPPSANAATQVQTIVDMKPTEEAQPKTTKEEIEIRDSLVQRAQEKIAVKNLLSTPLGELKVEPEPVIAVQPLKLETNPKPQDLDAHFVRDTIADGSKIPSEQQFVQIWTLRNPGPVAWPSGCSVRHVGGDNMLNIDNSRPLSQAELAEASESNVVGRSVEAGEEMSFRIVMKAPKREGTAISYWRLKKADGTPFGHRLWCDIHVVSRPTAPIAPICDAASESTSPIASVETAEASSSTTPTLTPYERFQQAKFQRLRELQKAQQQRKARTDASERTARVQEEALEQKKLKLEMEDLERANMVRAQKARKAAVERLMENKRKEQEHATEAMKLENSAVETAKSPVEEQPVAAAELQSSGMIFPKLDKESPASSTHEAIDSPSKFQEVKSEISVTAPNSEHSDEEFFEDAESVEIRSVSSDDEGFMTDEEYDILDASDEDFQH